LRCLMKRCTLSAVSSLELSSTAIRKRWEIRTYSQCRAAWPRRRRGGRTYG
jgi:hypothetical protein